MRAFLVAGIVFLVTGGVAPAEAQLPSEPIRALDGRLVVTGEASVTLGREDEEAYFNYTDYERNALRTLRLTLAAQWQPADRLAFVGELRSVDLESAGAYAAYVRVRPFAAVRFDLQAGRIPPVFGAYSRRSYTSDQLVIGYPLAYQYLTSLRTDSVPANPDDLLFMRGRGWRSGFPVGSLTPGPGVPLISAFRWDTGVEGRWSSDIAEAAVAVTTGTLSHPLVADDNGSKQVSGRVAFRPAVGLVIGASGARGGWISSEVPLPEGDRHREQSALGADFEYSRDYWIVRAEMVWSLWNVPFAIAPPEGNRVSALGTWVEGRYRFSPRWYLAGRADRLGFSKITGTAFNGVPTPWEAPVVRYEAGGGVYILRNVIARATVQFNHRDSSRARSRTFFAGQVSYWF